MSEEDFGSAFRDYLRENYSLDELRAAHAALLRRMAVNPDLDTLDGATVSRAIGKDSAEDAPAPDERLELLRRAADAGDVELYKSLRESE